MSSSAPNSPPRLDSWGFLTNHAQVLVCVADDPGARVRDIADRVGITERAAHRILSELIEAGYIVREKEGRRNRYEIVTGLSLRCPLVKEREIDDLLDLLRPGGWSSEHG